MKPANPPKRVLTINGGSSSIKFAIFEAGTSLQRILEGGMDRIGLPGATLKVKGSNPADKSTQSVTAPDHTVAVGILMDWIEKRGGLETLAAIGHRVVHGGPKYSQPERITTEMVAELRRISPFDPEHMPEELLLTEAFHRRFPDLSQVACFDTAFHHDMPRVAQLLPIPRRYETQGVRRYGFHGLSYACLMEELARLESVKVATGRVILAYLGSGASVAAVRDGQSLDTSMSFTPTAGVRAGRPRKNLRGTWIPWDRTRRQTEFCQCRGNFGGDRPSCRPRHSHGRGTHDCPIGLSHTRTSNRW